MLSVLGWIDGLSAVIVVGLGLIFGLFFMYQGIKKKVKLLKNLGLITIFAGLMYLGIFLDFLLVASGLGNFPYKNAEVAVISYIFFAPVMICASYMAGDLVVPDYKKQFIGIFLVLGIIFNVLIFLDPVGSFYIGFYENRADRLVDYNINMTSIAGIFFALMFVPIVLLLGLVLLIKSFKAPGQIRKQFLFLAAGAFCYGIFGLFEGLTQPGIMVLFVRIGYVSSFWFMYFGLKEALT